MIRKLLKYISTAALGLTVITAVPSAAVMIRADEEDAAPVITEEVTEAPFEEYTIAEEVPAEIVEYTPEYSEEPAETYYEAEPAEVVYEEYTEPAEVVYEEYAEPVETAYEEYTEPAVEAVMYTESDSYYEATDEEDALTYKDDLVEIKVSSTEEYTIPEGYSLQVTPILEGEENETEYTYEDVQTQIESVKEDVAGFLAYDIKLVDPEGNKFEPDGKVAVSINYTDAVLPVETTEELSVTVMHLEENEDGQVENVVDLNEAGQIEDLSTNTENKVESISFTTESFSVYTVTWTYTGRTYTLYCYYVDKYGNDLLPSSSSTVLSKDTETIPLYKLSANFANYDLVSIRKGSMTGTPVVEVQSSAGQYKYRAEGSNSFSLSEKTNVLYFIYEYATMTDHSLYINYVDGNGRTLAGSEILNMGRDQELNLYEKRIDIPGYNNMRIELETANGIVLAQEVRRVGNTNVFEYMEIDKPGWKTWYAANGKYTANYISEPILAGEGHNLGLPEHNKTIKKNMGTDDGADSYTLSLDVKGKQLPADPVDILLIIDYSTSMKEPVGNVSRIEAVNNAIQTLKDGLATTNEKSNVRFSVVGFNGPTPLVNSDLNYQSYDNDAFLRTAGWVNYNRFSANWVDCDGATNWQAGIRLGNRQFTGFQPNAQKYVIFLTDGAPTFRLGSTGTNWNGNGSTTYGAGNVDPNLHNFNCAVNEYLASSNLRKADGTYIVAASAEKNDATETKCNNFATAIGLGTSNVLSGYSQEALTAGFREIADRIALAAYRNVVIQDALSENVEFAFDVTGRNASSNISVYKTVNGRKTKLSSSEYEIDAALLQQGIVSVKLKDGASGDGYPLDDNAVYTVEFNVIPSKTALEAEMHGLPMDRGDYGTDAPGNSSSSGKAGYFSNNSDMTSLQYNEAGKNYSLEYRKPVIQVNTTSHSVEKKWLYTSDEELAGASVTLRLIPTAKVNNRTVNLIDNGFLAAEDITAVVSAGDNWSHTWNALPKYYYYYDATTGLAKHTPIIYSAEEINASSEFEVKVEEKDAATTVVTNTKRGELTVNKVWADGNGNHTGDTVYVILYKDGAPFVMNGSEVAVRLNDENNWTASFGALGDVQNGNFSIKELEGCVESKIRGNARLVNAENTYVTYTKAVENGTICTLSDVDYTTEYGNMSFTDAYHGKVSVTNTPKYNSITLNKVDSLDPTKKLSGAEFKLEVFENGEWKDYEVNGKALTVTSGSDGKVLFDNLPNGKYRITEVKAPEGYTLLADPIEIEMPNQGNGTDTKYNFTYSDPLLKNDVTVNYKAEGTVKNSPIYTLPDSGGIGTYVFTIVGVGIMAVAAILYLRNRRK